MNVYQSDFSCLLKAAISVEMISASSVRSSLGPILTREASGQQHQLLNLVFAPFEKPSKDLYTRTGRLTIFLAGLKQLHV